MTLKRELKELQAHTDKSTTLKQRHLLIYSDEHQAAIISATHHINTGQPRKRDNRAGVIVPKSAPIPRSMTRQWITRTQSS